LAKLRAARLLHVRRDGRHVFYTLAMPELAEWLDGGFAILESETAQMATVHDAIALARRNLHGESA
jgi:DNA-binding transcriptional ArsR family regulator